MTASSSHNFKVQPANRWRGIGYLLTACLALTLIVLGFAIGAGGVWLIILGGSWYYLFAAAGLIISGLLLLQQRLVAVWAYLVTWLGTLIWAYWEVGLNGWALVPRVVGPTLIVPFLLLAVIGQRRAAFGKLIRIYAPLGIAALTLVAVVVVAHWYHAEELQLRETAPQTSTVAITLSGPPIVEQKTTSVGVTVSPVPGSVLQVGRDWPAYGGSALAARFSPLKQVTLGNVAKLEKVWTFRTGDMPNEKANGRYAPETTPIKVGDHLFICTAKNILISVNAVSGKQEWRFDPKVSDAAVPVGAICRGVAYYEMTDPARANQSCGARIIEGTIDARLIVVDAKTGKPCSDFGQNGSVDLTEGLGDTVPSWYGVTSPPLSGQGYYCRWGANFK